jgi:PAS domain S-box-containing protein
MPESELDLAARAAVTQGLGVFAVGWLLAMLAWVAALSHVSAQARLPAMLTVVFQAGALGLALRASRHDPPRAHVNGTLFRIGVILAVSSIGLFVWVRSTGELLGFVLFTLCAMSALLFPWGWGMELALTATVLGLFALSFPWIRFVLQPTDLVPVIGIAALLCVAIAEGNSRSFRATLQRRRSEEAALRALAASRDSYRDLTENARDFIWAADLEARITYINEAGAQMLGQTPATLIGHHVDEFMAEHPANAGLAERRDLLRAGASVPPIVTQWRTVRGNSWIETVSYAVRGPDGEVTGFRGISRDVTERCEVEAALRESEARYRGLVESQEELIYRSDLQGTLTFINEACRRKYGVGSEAAERLSFFSFVHPDDVPQARAALQTVVSGGRYRRASRGRTPDGWRWIEWEVCAITDVTGTVTELQGVGHDVTERRAADEALLRTLSALREREEQLHLMGLRQVAIREEERKRLSFDLHDGVCQELVGIGILIESARRRSVSESAGPALELAQGYLRQVGEHLRMLARDLRPLQLSDLGLGECLRALAAGMTSETIRITVGFPTKLPRLAEETEVAVYRVAQEALANAVRHAGARAVTLTLDAANGALKLEVRDDGRGFDREALRSTALGLIAMEERAIMLGGRLRIRSEAGVGTTVSLECPLEHK